MIKNFIQILIASQLLWACGQRPPEPMEVDLDDIEVGGLEISSETMNEIIRNIASPIEMAALISSLDIPFSMSYLAEPEHLSPISRFEMACSLGILSADLGYLNMYEKTGIAVNYLTGIYGLADALQIGQFFDLETIRSLASNSSNRDSLMFISMNSFNRMDDHLRETGRSNLSALMIAGVWMESLYLATQVAKENSSEDLKSMIGEQKLILNDLLLVLNQFKNEKVIQGYISDLESLKLEFDQVRITYEVGEPQIIEEDGMLTVIQSESSQVTMSDETLEKIITTTGTVRNKLLHIES